MIDDGSKSLENHFMEGLKKLSNIRIDIPVKEEEVESSSEEKISDKSSLMVT